MKRVYIENGNCQYVQLFKSLGFEIVSYIEKGKTDLVCFTGGEDVSPELYGDAKHRTTWSNISRDATEKKVFDLCRLFDIPMVGICRGGQFLNVMSGGRMYQHVSEHARAEGHMMTDVGTGNEVFVSSTHHQMMMPGEGADVLAFATLGGYREWYDGQGAMRDESNTDYEVLYYAATKALCFQPHPEFTGEKYQDMRNKFSCYLNDYLGV